MMRFGATVEGAATRFRAFVTTCRTCQLCLYDESGALVAEHAMREVNEMNDVGDGHFEAVVRGAGHGTLYKFRVDGRELPDPYARYLPQGVHGPAMVVDPHFAWQHAESVARPLNEQVIYELHVGTFTPEGTYEAARGRLRELSELGITTVELMPLAAFPGARGWGYDGVALYAPFAPYGTPDELRRFVDEAHGLGLGVLLDVVYNHFGPSGNYLSAYSEHYFNRDVRTAWGDAPDFSKPVMRRYVLDNAQYWLTEFRFDGLRLDAVHAIVDRDRVLSMLRVLESRKLLVAEDERNDPDTVAVLGLDGVWADDFHHQVRVTLTGERDGYYGAYTPGVSGIAETIQRGWLYQGETYAPTGKPRGKSAQALPAHAFVYCIQNHDQIGNRALGDRLSESISLDAYCAASTLLLLLPMTPLLFMGQEWAARTPFLYFTDHEEPLGAAVSKGRREEFKAFAAFADEAARGAIPDPQAPATFERSRLRWDERTQAPHARVLELYRQLLRLRRTDSVFQHGARDRLRCTAEGGLLVVHRWLESERRDLLVNFDGVAHPLPEALHGRTLLFTSGAPLEDDRVAPNTAVVIA